MKYISKIIIGIFVLLFLKSCLGLFYIKITHLSTEDLKWIKCVEKYPIATFISNTGNISKLTLTSKIINNSTNPFYISSNTSNYYEANAWYRYEIKNKDYTLNGSFGITRLVNNNDLCYDGHLGALFSNGYKVVKPVTISFNGIEIENCILVDSISAHISTYRKNDSLQIIDKFIISRDYGPIYYRKKDGEEFYRSF